DIIHMNGRIYDANLGRFLQADPFVQFPDVTQSHNRYSYVLNNPLTYNDPSGYFLKKLMKITGLSSLLKAIAKIPILDAAVSIALGIYAPWALPLYQGLKTYAVTGSFGAALKAYVISSFTVGISEAIGGALPFEAGGLTAVANVASHAMVGGITSVLQGGKFGHGFVSSMVTASMKAFMKPQTGVFADAVKRTIIAGVVGGTVSELTGGKFANGAVTSAMQWWYNAEGGGEFAKKHHSYKITDKQREMAAAGDREGFWRSRWEDSKDPMGKIGLKAVQDEGGLIDYLTGGQAINNRLQAYARVYGDGPLDLNEVGIKLMEAHVAWTDGDRLGVHGLLSPRQIAVYHHDVFAEYGLPTTTFGGTPMTGALWEASATRAIWCWGCD
uniref:RHS repeat protein n=1 Tax=Pseudoalteromonas rubra TaxID=43658 RepID=UPI0023E875D3